MKSITGNIDKSTYDTLKEFLQRFKYYILPFGSYWKYPDGTGFEEWYSLEQISINPTDILFIDRMTDNDRMVVVGEVPETEDGDLIEYKENFLFIDELNPQTLIQIKDFLNG
jgi:hypothetical protein